MDRVVPKSAALRELCWFLAHHFVLVVVETLGDVSVQLRSKRNRVPTTFLIQQVSVTGQCSCNVFFDLRDK